MVTVPPSGYSHLSSSDAEVWRITTSDDNRFAVSVFEITDSLIVVQELEFDGSNRSRISQKGTRSDYSLPMHLTRDEIQIIEKEKTEYVAPILIIGIPAAIVLVGLAVYALAPPAGS